MIALGPIKRRVLYITLFEIFAVILTTFILVVLSGSDTKQSLILAVIIAITAVVWNFIYNTLLLLPPLTFKKLTYSRQLFKVY